MTDGDTRFDGMKMMPDHGHPNGRSRDKWFRIEGEKVMPDHGHPNGRSRDKWFRIE